MLFPISISFKDGVLIVPSGIETTCVIKCTRDVPVLIVPSGIETTLARLPYPVGDVLIVPSGIET